MADPGADPPPAPPPPPLDAVTAAQAAPMTSLHHMFNFIGIAQRDAAPVAVVEGEGTPPPSGTAAPGAPPSADQAKEWAGVVVSSIEAACEAVAKLPSPDDPATAIACRPAEDAAGADLAAAAAERSAAHTRLAAAVSAGRRRLGLATALHGALADDELRRLADAVERGGQEM